MVSNTCIIDHYGCGREEALAESEKVASYCHLNQKETLRLRLLTEELIGMMREMTRAPQAKFHIESEGTAFRLYLTADVALKKDKREKLVAVASSGKNEAHKGIMGLIRTVFEMCIDYNDKSEKRDSCYSMGAVLGPHPSAWSLQQYYNSVQQKKEVRRQEWDELKKSIVANLADDITVSVVGKTAEIVVLKNFT